MLLSLAGWWWGDKIAKKARAKEIAQQFLKIQKDGDSLAKQVHEEMNSFSDTDWGDIPIRPSAPEEK